MKIGIDGRPLQTVSRYRGIGTYTHNLIKTLLALDKDNHYVIFGFKGGHFPALKGGNIELAPVLRELGVDSRWIWESFFMNRILSRYGLDLFHVTQPCCIAGFAPYRIVATVHDIYPLAMGGGCYKLLRPDRKIAYKRQLMTIRRAERIIAVSRATADDLVRLLNISRDGIAISHEGSNDCFKPISDRGLIEKQKSKYGIKGEYVLFIGNAEPRKNLLRLLRVFPEVRRRMGDVGLVIVSDMPRRHRREIHSTARDLSIDSSINILGYIPLHDLAAIMNGALMLAFPSFYEGFGLPVLEAMACGTPVLTSNTSSLPEVTGDAAILIDPSSDEEIRDAIIRILSDEGLRGEMRLKGLERAKLFSWRRHADDVLKVYREVVGSGERTGARI